MSDPDLRNRHAFITGGARGIGLVMAQALVDAGAKVTITAARSADELSAAAARLGAERCFGLLTDVCDDADSAQAVAAAQTHFGPVDILINNAARGPGEMKTPAGGFGARPFDGDSADYERIIATNIVGPWRMAKLLVPGMVARGWGRVINISTSQPTMRLPNGGPYGPTKAALETQSAIWAKHLEGTGVTVNVLLPGGATDTPFIPGGTIGQRVEIDWPARAGDIAEGNANMTGLLPPEVMAAPTVWLASDASQHITGRRIVGANWPPDAPAEVALETAMTPIVAVPQVI
ncbi:MAG: SDR family oxidoreductase [Pseudomonadota bacterium]